MMRKFRSNWPGSSVAERRYPNLFDQYWVVAALRLLRGLR
jgi:hypothetical protein